MQIFDDNFEMLKNMNKILVNKVETFGTPANRRLCRCRRQQIAMLSSFDSFRFCHEQQMRLSHQNKTTLSAGLGRYDIYLQPYLGLVADAVVI